MLAILFPFVLGTLAGTLAGYYGGIVDAVVSRVVDVVIAFPFYVLVIALVFVVGTGTRGIYVAFAVAAGSSTPAPSRATTLVVREAGLRRRRPQRRPRRPARPGRHVLPNTITQAIVYAMNDIVLVHRRSSSRSATSASASSRRPRDWGAMISDGQPFLTTHWTLATIPGLAVAVTGLGLSLIGDGLADVLRPR